jgi:hypothetical protein
MANLLSNSRTRSTREAQGKEKGAKLYTKQTVARRPTTTTNSSKT